MDARISLNIYTDNPMLPLGTLELTDHGDFPLAISWSTGDFTDITKRSGSYSKTFRVPASKLNNRILQYIYQIGINFYDAYPACRGEVLYNGIAFFSGRLKINAVSQDLQPQEYDLELVGENLDWVEYMKNHSIRDIDYGNRATTYFPFEFSEPLNLREPVAATAKSHPFTEKYVVASWQNFPAKFDFVYGLKSYGAWKHSDKVVTDDLRPDVSIRHIITEAFRKSGYTLTSQFIDSDYFKKLVLTFTGDAFGRAANTNDSMLFKALLCAERPFNNIRKNSTLGPDVLPLPDCAGHVDMGNNFSNNRYTVQGVGKQRFVAEVQATMNNWFENLKYLGIGIAKIVGGTIVPIKEEAVVFSGNAETQNVTIDTDFLTFAAGEQICVYTLVKTHSWGLPNVDNRDKSPRFVINQVNFYNEVAGDIVEGMTYEVSQVLPDIKQIEVLTGLMNMFNLYFRTDTTTKTVFCEPRDQFLKPLSQAHDWSQKLDASKDIEIQYLDSYKRNLTFQYKLDSNDAFLKQQAEATQKQPASLSHTLPPKYDPGKQELGAKEFAYTLTFQDWSIFHNLNPTNVAPIIPRLWKELAGPPAATYEFVPRIMCFEGYATKYTFNAAGQLKPSAWRFGQTVSFRTKYPQLSAATLQYGQSTGLVNTYYRHTLAQIEDGRQVVCWFYLNFTDILNMDLQRPIYLDHPTLKGYYYITTVADYRPSQGLPVKLTLLPVLADSTVNIDLSTEADYTTSKQTTPSMGAGTGAANRFNNALLGENRLTPSTVLNNGTGNWAPAGTAAVAIGQGVIANARNQTVLGAYNVVSATDMVQIGGGTSPTDRYRALTFTQDGNFLVQGGYLYTTDGREIVFASQRGPQGQVKRFDKLHLKGNG